MSAHTIWSVFINNNFKHYNSPLLIKGFWESPRFLRFEIGSILVAAQIKLVVELVAIVVLLEHAAHRGAVITDVFKVEWAIGQQ